MKIDLPKVNRIEVIDHTKEGVGRVYSFWGEYNRADDPDPSVTLSIQDDGRTLKVFILNKNE